MARRVRDLACKVLALWAVWAVCRAQNDNDDSDSDSDFMAIPQELIDVWPQIYGHFCNTRPPTRPLGQTDAECSEQGRLCNPGQPAQCCSTEADDTTICQSNSQMFQCQFDDVVVCKGELDICMYDLLGTIQPFCVCTSGSQTRKNGRCSLDASGTGVYLASGLSVFIIVLLLVLIFWVLRRGTCCCPKDTRSASSPDGNKEAGTGARSGDYEQALPCPNEYSYAYGHVQRSPASDPAMVPQGPDLDEQQDDHYYSRLRREPDRPDGNGDSPADRTNSSPETGPTLEDRDSRRAPEPPGHSGERDGRDEGRSSGYEVARTSDVTPAAPPDGRSSEGAPSGGVDSGYEVARVGDVRPTDSGYEVATVPSHDGNDEEVAQTFFVLDPKDADTGYEEATIGDDPQAEDVCQSPGYDRLKRPVLELTNEGALAFNKP